MKNALLLSTTLAATLIASSAFAATIDFRGADFAGSDGLSEVVYTASDGVTLTITPEPQPDATLYWDSTDGFGVRYSYEADEIEGPETLSIDFDDTVLVTDVSLTDLFYESTDGAFFNYNYYETGRYSTDGGYSWVNFSADPTQVTGTNGELVLSIGQQTDSLLFRAPGQIKNEGHEFSVAGLSYEALGANAVPELDPGSAGAPLALLFGGAVVLGRRRRWQRG